MGFWEVFAKESLQQPWVVQGAVEEAEVIDQPDLTKIFVIEEECTDEGLAMVGKMVAALNYAADEVLILSSDDPRADNIEQWTESKKILFFGERFPGSMGVEQNWQGHHVMKTHSIQSLIAHPELKKQTWAHLKAYAGTQ